MWSSLLFENKVKTKPFATMISKAKGRSCAIAWPFTPFAFGTFGDTVAVEIFIILSSSRSSLIYFSLDCAYPAINQSINQSISQSVDRSINRSINKSVNQSNNQYVRQSINRLNRLIDRSINRPIFFQPIYRSANQSIASERRGFFRSSIDKTSWSPQISVKKHLSELDKRTKYFPFGDDLPFRSVVYRECNLHVIRCDGLTASFAWNTLPLAEVLLRSGS